MKGRYKVTYMSYSAPVTITTFINVKTKYLTLFTQGTSYL